MRNANQKNAVKDWYGKIARQNDPKESDIETSCCANGNTQIGYIQIGEMLGYSENQLLSVPDGANLGLGCGNPVSLGEIKQGDRVLDLGSGAGFDTFLAAKRCGDDGMVIGVDFAPDMIAKARKNPINGGYTNVCFILGDIEDLSNEIEEGTIDVVISNCVINLSPNKEKVFQEAYRVLKKGGKIFISDIVLLKELSEQQREDEDLICGCVGGAALRDSYIAIIKAVGFQVVKVDEDRDISKQQYSGMPVSSLKLVAEK